MYRLKMTKENLACSSYSNAARLSLFEQPNPQILEDNFEICQQEDAIQLNASPTGGFWFGQGVSNTGLFDPSSLSPGFYSISYIYTNMFGCAASDQITITIKETAEILIAEDDFVICNSGNPIQLNTNTNGGLWSGTGVDSNGLFDPQGLETGVYQITYSYNETNGCIASDQINITIVDKPVVNIIESDFSLCIDANPVLLTTNLSGRHVVRNRYRQLWTV